MTTNRSYAVTVAAVLLAFVAGLHLWLEHVGPLPGERGVLSWFRTYEHTQLTFAIPAFFGDLGSAPVAMITVAVAAWLVDRRFGRADAVVVLLAGLVVFPSAALQRLWPATPLMIEYGAFRPPNYPSDHVAYMTAVFGALAWIAIRNGRRDVAGVLCGLVLASGPAMVLKKAHFPSDVLGGYALGGAWLVLVMAVASRWRRGTEQSPALGPP